MKPLRSQAQIESRQRDAEALTAGESELDRIVSAIPGLVWSARPDGSAEFFNQQYLAYVGLPLEQLQGTGWTAAVHPDDLGALVAAWKSIMAAGQAGEAEARLRRYDGNYRWFLFRANPLRDKSGSIVKWFGANTDIEDRKRAELAIMASQRNFEVVMNTIPSLAWSARPDGYTDFVSRRWLEYTGLSREQSEGWGWMAAIHPDDLKGVVDYCQSSLGIGSTAQVEARIRRVDGTYRWFVFRTNPLRDESGNVVKWYGTNTDIEDRKRAEEALSQSEERARLIVDSIDGLVMTATPKGEVESVNKQVLEYFGKSLEELKNWQANDAIHPDDLPRAAGLWTHSVETGEPYVFEQRLRRADSAYRWFHVRGRCLRDAQGHVVRWYVLLTDIDERKRAEVELRRAYDSFADGQRMSQTGNFTADIVADEHIWSAELYRIFEFDSATKITVQMVRDVIHPEDLPSFEARFARSLGGADFDLEFRIVMLSGKIKHVHSIGRLVERVAGRPLFIGAIQDITERKTAEEALNKARSELARVARITTLNALTASIAHEVNQPLSGIVTNASTCLRMLDGDPPNVEGARETARRTMRDGKRAADVVTRLRAMFSKKDLAMEPLDLNEATREVIALSLSDLQRNRVILRSELADDLPPVNGDRVQIQQVILNLLRNASDAMITVEDRPRELLIRTQRHEGDRVCLTVKDVGVGFAPEAGDKLFEPFHTTKKDGMGIGLSLSRSVIEAHHGRLWATPNDGPGAAFSFSIPGGVDTKVQ